MAADKGHIEVVEMLLDRSANIEAVNKVSRNVIMACTALRIVPIVIVVTIIMIIIIINIMMMTIIIIIVITIIIMSIVIIIIIIGFFSCY